MLNGKALSQQRRSEEMIFPRKNKLFTPLANGNIPKCKTFVRSMHNMSLCP